MLHFSRVALCGVLLTCATTTYAFTIPAYDGFVTDRAGVLKSSEKQELETLLSTYRTETSNEIAILLVSTLDGEPISDAAVATGREWGVGRGDVNNGVLILVAVDDRELFIATGYGLEGALPDLLVHQIIENEITPYFRTGNYFLGLRAGISALQQAIAGEYEPVAQSSNVGSDIFPMLLWSFFVLIPWFGAILGRTKSWWLGGVLGFVAGVFLWLMAFTAIAIPVLVFVGLLFDFIVSKKYKPGARKNPWYVGGGWGPGGGGRGSGGSGGFSGGSFGGGGAGGRW